MNQLKTLGIIILTAILFTSIIEMSHIYAQETALKTFDTTEFKIDYPLTWEIASRDSSFPYYGTATVVVFKPVGESMDPSDNSYLNISPLELGKSLDKTTLTVSPDSLDKIVEDKIAFLKDPTSMYGSLNVEILKNNATTVSDLPAKELTYLIHGLGTFNMDTIVIKGDKQYDITFTTPELKVPETLPIVQQMIKSLKFNS